MRMRKRKKIKSASKHGPPRSVWPDVEPWDRVEASWGFRRRMRAHYQGLRGGPGPAGDDLRRMKRRSNAPVETPLDPDAGMASAFAEQLRCGWGGAIRQFFRQGLR